MSSQGNGGVGEERVAGVELEGADADIGGEGAQRTLQFRHQRRLCMSHITLHGGECVQQNGGELLVVALELFKDAHSIRLKVEQELGKCFGNEVYVPVEYFYVDGVPRVKDGSLVRKAWEGLGRDRGGKVAVPAEVLMLPWQLVIREVNLVVLHLEVNGILLCGTFKALVESLGNRILNRARCVHEHLVLEAISTELVKADNGLHRLGQASVNSEQPILGTLVVQRCSSG
mmetsp:Transcript_15794/g.61725  ORF Transcript_15794/g.61725 Transcript_15794/m.61725 type:complete len:230 (-) Transcript_15794:900-1589(-)